MIPIRARSSVGAIPLLFKEGWLRDQENVAQLPLNAQTGWLVSSRKFGTLRDLYKVASRHYQSNQF